jgi:hypothetical protein
VNVSHVATGTIRFSHAGDTSYLALEAKLLEEAARLFDRAAQRAREGSAERLAQHGAR